MARVVAYIPDLLFGSQVQGSLSAAGHEVKLIGGEDGVREALTGADVLLIDLTDEPARRAGLLRSLPSRDMEGVRTLAFYSHVDVEARRQAESAGFDLVVPRSRMAREGAELVTHLTGEPV
ncbi:MAG TPA: hypothetical protein VIG42_07290 [Solirubrobacteraceae bacterium]|jgi:hypothetical protein